MQRGERKEMTMEIYYGATLFLMAGCGFMSQRIGRREGIERFLAYLDSCADDTGKVTIRITETDFEVINE
tara:strand:- start:774 stop:983 length:210 start_codon:yes stop_codon:yes gene_type:complete